MSPTQRLLLISGSLRAGSSNAAALLTAQALAPAGTTATLHHGLARLPHFNPDDDHDPLPSSVEELRRQIAAADAVLFSTPEYAGTLPGSFKNLLDWIVGGGELNEKPCAWLNVAPQGRGGGATATLATVLTYLGARIVPEACVDVPLERHAINASGLIDDPQARAAIRSALQRLAGASVAGGGGYPLSQARD